MRIKMNGLFNVVNEKGEKLDELSARATMHYMGTSGSGTFHFNEQGDFVRFSAWRYQGNEPDSERVEWVITVDEYREFDGIRVPSKMKATWRLQEGDWTWLDLEITSLKYYPTVFLDVNGNTAELLKPYMAELGQCCETVVSNPDEPEARAVVAEFERDRYNHDE